MNSFVTPLYVLVNTPYITHVNPSGIYGYLEKPLAPRPTTLDPRPSTLNFNFFFFLIVLIRKFGKQYQVNVGSPSATNANVFGRDTIRNT